MIHDTAFSFVINCLNGKKETETQVNSEDDVTYQLIDLKQEKTDKPVTIPVLETTKVIIKSGLPYQISIQKKWITKYCG